MTLRFMLFSELVLELTLELDTELELEALLADEPGR